MLVKKDLACFQIQEIVFLISILLQRLSHHLVQQNGMKLSLWGLLNFWTEDWMKNFRELLKQGYLLLQFIHLLRQIILELQVIVPHQKVFEVHYLMELHQFHLIQHHLQFRLGLRPQFSLYKCSTCGIAELSRRDVWCWKYFDTARTSFEGSSEDGRILWGIFEWPSFWNSFWKYSLWESRS